MNNMLLERAEKWLNELGIKTERADTFLKVNQSDMLAFTPGEAFILPGEEILKELKTALNSPRLCWGLKDDTWLYLESY